VEHTWCRYLNVSDAESVDEDARPQEISPFCKLAYVACGVTEAAEVKINIELCSSGLLCSEYLLRNNPEECSYLLRSGSLQSFKDHLNFLISKTLTFCCLYIAVMC
jgi:hypothetical protein